jgi:hypothetical protein
MILFLAGSSGDQSGYCCKLRVRGEHYQVFGCCAFSYIATGRSC